VLYIIKYSGNVKYFGRHFVLKFLVWNIKIQWF